MNREPKGFIPTPYPYHHELEIEISDITNLGIGIGRDNDWVIQVPYCWPGEKIRAKIFRNHSNYSQADLVEAINPSPRSDRAYDANYMEVAGDASTRE